MIKNESYDEDYYPAAELPSIVKQYGGLIGEFKECACLEFKVKLIISSRRILL